MKRGTGKVNRDSSRSLRESVPTLRQRNRESRLEMPLVHLPAGAHPRVEFDFAEGSLVAGDILL